MEKGTVYKLFESGTPIFHRGGVPDSYFQSPSENPEPAMTYGFSNYQQTGKCSMDFTFCQFWQVDIRKWGSEVPNSFHFYAK